MLKAVKRNYNLHFSADRMLARKLKSILGFAPIHIYLYKLAFYHKSMNGDTDEFSQNNERLEYLGDAILSTIVAEYLFKKYPAQNEGFLTKMRSKIVKRTTLNDIAERMGLDMILADYSQGRLSNAMMGNALEALVGALYLERGYTKARNYVINHILRKFLDIHELENLDDNYKSQLLEWCQKHNREVSFRVISKFKHNKRDRFKIGVYIDGNEVTVAEDYNKKSAEQLASELALQQISIAQNGVNGVEP